MKICFIQGHDLRSTETRISSNVVEKLRDYDIEVLINEGFRAIYTNLNAITRVDDNTTTSNFLYGLTLGEQLMYLSPIDDKEFLAKIAEIDTKFMHRDLGREI